MYESNRSVNGRSCLEPAELWKPVQYYPAYLCLHLTEACNFGCLWEHDSFPTKEDAPGDLLSDHEKVLHEAPSDGSRLTSRMASRCWPGTTSRSGQGTPRQPARWPGQETVVHVPDQRCPLTPEGEVLKERTSSLASLTDRARQPQSGFCRKQPGTFRNRPAQHPQRPKRWVSGRLKESCTSPRITSSLPVHGPRDESPLFRLNYCPISGVPTIAALPVDRRIRPCLVGDDR